MIAEIITIGDEILIGQIVDTNSQFISKKINSIGVEVTQITSISDKREQILDNLQRASLNSDLVIVTGGLGPTNDDVTKQTVCDFFKTKLTLHKETLSHIENLWLNIIKRPLLQVNKDQALIPDGAEVFMNNLGTAPGLWYEFNNTIFVFLPGVPTEMKYLVNEHLLPKLQANYKLPFIIHRTLLLTGIGESNLAHEIKDWEDNLPSNISLAYLPSYGRIRLRLTSKGDNKDEVNNNIDNQVSKLLPLIEAYFVSFQNDNALEGLVYNLLLENKLTLSFAESCTGGMLSSLFTRIQGASKVYKGGIVAYSEDIKNGVLNVSKELIDTYSVYSEEVSKEMAGNCLKMFNSDFSISTTGNAGPNVQERGEKGEVFISVAYQNQVFTEKLTFHGNREQIINKTSIKSIELIYKILIKKYKK